MRLEDMLLQAKNAGIPQEKRHALADIYRESMRQYHTQFPMQGSYTVAQRLDHLDLGRDKAYAVCREEMLNMLLKYEKRGHW